MFNAPENNAFRGGGGYLRNTAQPQLPQANSSWLQAVTQSAKDRADGEANLIAKVSDLRKQGVASQGDVASAWASSAGQVGAQGLSAVSDNAAAMANYKLKKKELETRAGAARDASSKALWGTAATALATGAGLALGGPVGGSGASAIAQALLKSGSGGNDGSGIRFAGDAFNKSNFTSDLGFDYSQFMGGQR
jgi:hypothetical protein